MSGRVVVIGPLVTIINDNDKKPTEVKQEEKKTEALDIQETRDMWKSDSTADFDRAWADYCK